MRRDWTRLLNHRLYTVVAKERVEEKRETVFRHQPALTLGIDHVYDFGLFQSKIIVI
jgi:hypothetical protein